MIRFCPNCQSERPLTEFLCLGQIAGADCGWDLSQIAIHPEGWQPDISFPEPPPVDAQPSRLCPNGHAAEAGDLICPICSADVSEDTAFTSGVASPGPTRIAGWSVDRQLTTTSRVRERFLVNNDEGHVAQLTLYALGSEPDDQVYDVLRSLPHDHVPEIIETGRWNDRPYEVAENVGEGTLADLDHLSTDFELLTELVREVSTALRALHECGLRHRDLRPGAILIRSRDPLDLVISNFGSARLSEFDLDIVSPLETTRYTAPEAIAGGVAAASDWWSLGILLLEQVTRGACFEGVNEQAFLIHVMTNGAPVPEGLDPRLERLLRGLLTRDRHDRWGWPQVEMWLAGEEPPITTAASVGDERAKRSLSLGERPFDSPARLALAAAQAANWEEAKLLLMTGSLATWAQEAALPEAMQAEFRRIARMEEVSDDLKLGLALKALNPALPLTVRGEIVTPGWLLDHPTEGYELIAGPLPDILKDRGEDVWLSRLKARSKAVRDRAAQLDIRLEETELRVHLLATSRSRLAAVWADRRRLLPDTDHPGLVAILERRQTSEEDYILLLAASAGQFRSTDEILEQARVAARKAGISSFDDAGGAERLARTRREMVAEIAERVAGFARSGNPRADEWADQFRLEGRLPLDRMLALLAVPAEQWREPPKQAYVATILDFFAKRVVGSVLRGPLTRLIIGKTTARFDIAEIGSDRRQAAAILDHLLLRNGQPIDIDPSVFVRVEGLERRLRTLHSHATLYRRDTGIDGLYMGFPFLLMREAKSTAVPRIAPVLLWPVKLTPEVGGRGRVTVAFDRDREEVRLNPALEPLLGVDAAARWRALAQELLGRATLNASDVIDAFEELAVPDSRKLTGMPSKDVKVTRGEDRVSCSAAFFHLAYVGQAVMEDLKQLKSVPPGGTALEAALRIGATAQRAPVEKASETERFFTAASDPSQEAAVLEARSRPGLLIEGPPGTGKSQTIVNIVADAIGRNKSLLIVCQKQAALEVVMKRLAAEGLDSRVIMINDVNKDRRAIISAVREQLESLWDRPQGSGANWRQHRQKTAVRIEALEDKLDRHNAALHRYDERCGLSYRLLLSDLVEGEGGATRPIEAPSLRNLFLDLDVAAVAAIEEACGPIARLWLPSNYETSALAVLKPFGADAGSLAAFKADFDQFSKAESTRARVLVETPHARWVDDPVPHLAWVRENANRIRALVASERLQLANWLPLFGSDGRGSAILEDLDRTASALDSLAAPPLHRASMVVEGLSDAAIVDWKSAGEQLLVSPTLLQKLSPGRWFRERRLSRFLIENGMVAADLPDFVAALRSEIDFRPMRSAAKALLERLDCSPILAGRTPGDIAIELRQVRNQLQKIEALAAAVDAYSNPQPLRAALQTGDAAIFEAFVLGTEQGCARYRAREQSRRALSALEPWMSDAWRAGRLDAIESERAEIAAVEAIEAAMPSAAAYLRFRPRADQLEELPLRVFGILRSQATALEGIPDNQLDHEVRRVIKLESRLAWKARLEADFPILLLDATELDTKIRALADADIEMRALNRRLLIDGIDVTSLRPAREWEDITRLQGQRARRLREFLDRGSDLGLMALRPVWLMNPDVASRVLPLRPGLFDTVIYDEASQIPVEYALPTLYRSKTMVVSGDEKQMPPTAFFTSRVENDEADVFDGEEADPDATETEREALEETWNRREIKDCPDLLQLAKGVLPSTTLQIHYRSVYRELIQFSNAAFYSGRLSVPARHPQSEIRRSKPIEVIRADGVYENQTNLMEAERVIDLLADYWRAPREQRPSLAVVTFNRKQTDLIEDLIEERAERDDAFRLALTEERDRVEEGEDMGFFVKNVENVQGDERDVMVFSSTFGRNSQGTFRRAFGPLGAVGGERRLNVAVTRARSKVILVTSMPVSEISDFLATRRIAASPRDFLQAYFEYAGAISEGELDIASSLLSRLSADKPTRRLIDDERRDGFEQSVANYIRTLGYEPLSGGDEGAFALDFAIVDPRTGTFGFGIECDAPRHPLLERARAREIWRPSVLRRSIPAIHRVSSEAWYNNPGGERLKLQDAILNALGVTGGVPIQE